MTFDHFSFVLQAKALVESHSGHLTRNDHNELAAIIGNLTIVLLLSSDSQSVAAIGRKKSSAPRITYGTRHHIGTYSGIRYVSTSPERILLRVHNLIATHRGH